MCLLCPYDLRTALKCTFLPKKQRFDVEFSLSATCGPQTCGCRGSGPSVRIGRVLHTSLSRAQHAHGGWICWIRRLSDVAETWWDAGGNLACPDTDPFSARCQNREGHSPLAIHIAEFCMPLLCLLRVWLFAMGRVLALLDL
jgi:hypothetical protein